MIVLGLARMNQIPAKRALLILTCFSISFIFMTMKSSKANTDENEKNEDNFVKEHSARVMQWDGFGPEKGRNFTNHHRFICFCFFW